MLVFPPSCFRTLVRPLSKVLREGWPSDASRENDSILPSGCHGMEPLRRDDLGYEGSLKWLRPVPVALVTRQTCVPYDAPKRWRDGIPSVHRPLLTVSSFPLYPLLADQDAHLLKQ